MDQTELSFIGDGIIADDLTVDELESDGRLSGTVVDAVIAGNATQAGIQVHSLQQAIDSFSAALNASAIAKSTGLPVRTPAAQYKGFAAEEYFKHTFMLDALSKGIPDWQVAAYTNGVMPDGTVLSRIDMETDIAIWVRDHPWCAPRRAVNYQAKMHNRASAYAKDISSAQYANVEFVGGDGQGVNSTINATVGKKTISSDPITPQEAERLAERMKQQNAPEYRRADEKIRALQRLNLLNAVKTGAIAGAVVSTIQEFIDVIKHRDSLSEDQFVESIRNILYGSADGAVRSGTIFASVQAVGHIMGKTIAMDSLGSIPIAVAANVAVDLAKDLYRCFVSKSIDTDDLLCNSVNNMFSSFASIGGGWAAGQLTSSLLSAKTAAEIGASMGTPFGPIGTVIGATVGAVLIGIGANAIIGQANKDAAIRFDACIRKINSDLEHEGFDRVYYFIDEITVLAEFRLSFKCLLPCYNLISDLREFNMRKKKLKEIVTNLEVQVAGVDEERRRLLLQIRSEHEARIRELYKGFEEEKGRLFGDFRDSVMIYISNSYEEYLEIVNIITLDTNAEIARMEGTQQYYTRLLELTRERNTLNSLLNAELADMISDPVNTENAVRPFIERLMGIIAADQLVARQQFISFEQSMSLVTGE